MSRGGCIPDLARTGGAGGVCNPHVVGPHRRTVSECAETGAPGVPTIRCRSVRHDALAARTAGWAMETRVDPHSAAGHGDGQDQGAKSMPNIWQSARCRHHRPPRRSRKATTSRRALGCYMHGGLAGRLAGASRWGLFLPFAPLGPSSHERTPRARGAGLSPMIHARPPRWRLGDAPKRMPCAFLCLSCESLTCLLHDSARAAAAVGAWNGHPAGWMHTSTPPSWWLTARAKTDGGQDMSIPAGWVSVADADKWMRSQPSAMEAIWRG